MYSPAHCRAIKIFNWFSQLIYIYSNGPSNNDCIHPFKFTTVPASAPARIRKGQGTEAMNRAFCIASRKLGYTRVGNERG